MQREFRKLAASFRAAFNGLARATKNERNFRIHICAVFYVLFFAIIGKIEYVHYPVIFMCFGTVMAVELINSVTELLCDVVSDRFDMLLKAVKDMAAGAVLIAAVGSGAAGLFIFARFDIIRNVMISLSENRYHALLLILSIPVSVLYIAGRKKG